MTITTEQTHTEGERLSRVEAIQEALVREVNHLREDLRHLRTEMRIYFIALLTMTVTMWVSLMVVLITRM